MGILVCFFVLCLCTITRNGFWHDEVRTALAGRMTFTNMIEERAAHGHTPLFFVLSWIWQNLAGEGEFQLRLFPVLWALASTFVLFFIVERLTASKQGFWAATLLLLNPEFISMAQQARMYTLLSLIALLAVYLIIRCEADPGWRHVLGLYVLFTLMLYTHYSAILIYCALMVYLLARRRICWKLTIAWVMALLTFIPWIIYSQGRFGSQTALWWLRPFHIVDTMSLLVKLSGTVQIMPLHQIAGWMIVVPAMISLATISIAAWAFVAARREGRILAVLIVFPIVAATVMGLLGYPNYIQMTRYFIVLIPALAAIYAIGLIRDNVTYRKVRIGAMFFLLAMNTSGLVGYFLDDQGFFFHLKPGRRQAPQTIENLKSPSKRTYLVNPRSPDAGTPVRAPGTFR